jgi:hypothetical protein
MLRCQRKKNSTSKNGSRLNNIYKGLPSGGSFFCLVYLRVLLKHANSYNIENAFIDISFKYKRKGDQ